jgi:WD40 repeat protein
MTCLCIVSNGDYFVSGSADKTLKYWHYDDGTVQQIGYGHSGLINSVAISPDNKSAVSVGSEGGIFIWTLPVIS